MPRELTARDLIDLMNRRQRFRQKQSESPHSHGVKAEYFRGVQAELSYLLGRCTAHNEGIRPIDAGGD